MIPYMNLYQLGGGPQFGPFGGGYFGQQGFGGFQARGGPVWGGGDFMGHGFGPARGGPVYPGQMGGGMMPHQGPVMWGGQPPMYGGGQFNLGNLGGFAAQPARPIRSVGY